MLFWLLKSSVSPVCSVPGEIVTVALVRLVSSDDTVSRESTGTAEPAEA